MSDPAQQMEDL